MGNIEYKYKEATIESLVEENEEAEVTPPTVYVPNYYVPNQCWGGYYDKSIFDLTHPSPQNGQQYHYKDFGMSIQNYGCAVCCCVGAYNRINDDGVTKKMTVYDFWKLNGFQWNPNITNKKGQSCGTTLARWNVLPGISISTGNVRYDDTRSYSFCRRNSYYQEPNTSGISTSDFKVEGSSFHNELTDDYKKKQVAAIKKIIEEVDKRHPCIIFICNSTRNSGHYVLAYSHTHGSGHQYSYDQIIVYDPCPTLEYFNNTENPKRANNYYGAQCTLAKSMQRINSDISDGIRTVAVCTTKSQ